MKQIDQPFRDIDVALLRSFLAIQDQHGFTPASRAVGRSQSAISMHMRRLEAIVGAPIFHRDGRKTRLTAHGETLLGYARQMVALNDRTSRPTPPSTPASGSRSPPASRCNCCPGSAISSTWC